VKYTAGSFVNNAGNGNEGVSDSFTVVTLVIQAAWHNATDPADVDGENGVTAIDVLTIINWINSHPNDTSLPSSPASGPPFYDVNNDKAITPRDVLLVINYINNHPAASAEGEGIVGLAAEPGTPVATGAMLPARAFGGLAIWLDRNAAGVGRFFDDTPPDDSGFSPSSAGPSLRARTDETAPGADLLTVLGNELGRVMGLDHEGLTIEGRGPDARPTAPRLGQLPIVSDLDAVWAELGRWG